MNIELLQIILMKFRIAIEEFKGIQSSSDEHDLDINEIMSKFPKSCCAYTCQFLGHYLNFDLGIKPIVNCFGVFKNGGSHEWLKYEEYIIDITLDQFDAKFPKIFFSLLSEFHRNKFATIKESEGLFDFKHWSSSQIKYYNGLIKLMNS